MPGTRCAHTRRHKQMFGVPSWRCSDQSLILAGKPCEKERLGFPPRCPTG
jgi:hypothetical protein